MLFKCVHDCMFTLHCYILIALECFHLSKFYLCLDEKPPLLKQCSSYFNCRLLNNNNGHMPKYLLCWPGRQRVREKYLTAKRVRSPKSLGTAGLGHERYQLVEQLLHMFVNIMRS